MNDKNKLLYTEIELKLNELRTIAIQAMHLLILNKNPDTIKAVVRTHNDIIRQLINLLTADCRNQTLEFGNGLIVALEALTGDLINASKGERK